MAETKHIDLFASHQSKQAPILLIDASGSVISCLFNGKTVFDKIKELIMGLEEQEFRVIFWNSDMNAQKFFAGGIYKLPFVVKKASLEMAFSVVKPNIHGGCLTFPHLGFESIPSEWISLVEPTKIYFITDGEMGYSNITTYDKNGLKLKLQNAIQKLFTKFTTIQLNIITVEPKTMDFTQIETLQRAAGCDVYNVIMDNHLTKYITKFVSYTLNNLTGFVHINKIIPPPGFVPFGDQYFSEQRIGEFVKYLVDLINNTKDDNELLKIVQYLSSTLCVLTKDKPVKMQTAIIKTFCGLFAGTTLDNMFVHFILSDAVEKENAGSADIFAAYRARMRDLYKQANELLLKNVKDAIGINETFLTLPLDNKIIAGHFRMIDRNLIIKGTTYPQSGISINQIILPIIPFDYTGSSAMNEQCLRQWVRVLISKMYGVNAMEDIVIYLVLSIVLKIVLSDVDDDIKNAYRKLGTVMLRKKRMNSDMTELERLENGELPIPNSGKIEAFHGYMEQINRIYGLALHPMTTWYAMCLALNNESLMTKQLIHCQEHIKQNFPELDSKNLLDHLKSRMEQVVCYKIPFESVLDYHCLITLEDTSVSGGYRFLPHHNFMGVTCCPVYVLSRDGYRTLMENPETSVCPICFTRLNDSHFGVVGPKPSIPDELSIFGEGIVNLFSNDAVIPEVKILKHVPISTTSSTHIPMTSDNYELKNKGTVVLMRGVVGSGKTTFSMKIKERVEAAGNKCIVVGVDQYCKTGMSVPDAITKIKEELVQIDSLDAKRIVVVIDTCGDKQSSNNVFFGVDFRKWKKVNAWPNLQRTMMDEYLAWTLRNVLRRGVPTETDHYYLNPANGNLNTCIQVHKTKTRSLFGKKNQYILPEMSATMDEVMSHINDKADAYQQMLDTKMLLDEQVDKIYIKL